VGGEFCPGGGIDYAMTDATLLFEPGDVAQYVNMDIVDDNSTEDDETIVLRLTNPINAALDDIQAGAGILLDHGSPFIVQCE